MENTDRELQWLICHLGEMLSSDTEEALITLVIFPRGKGEILQQLKDVEIFGGQMDIEIGNVEYLVRITSPNVKVIDGEFSVTKAGLLEECHDHGYFSRTCRLEGKRSSRNMVFSLEWVLTASFLPGFHPRPTKISQETYTRSTKKQFHSSHLVAMAAKELEQLGVGDIPQQTDKSNPTMKREDSGYSGSSRPSEELEAAPLLETQDPGFNGNKSPYSSGSDDGVDIYSSSLDSTKEEAQN